MKVEIKKISIMSLIASALPLAIFVMSFIGSFVQVYVESERFYLSLFGPAIFRALQATLAIWIITIFGVFVYNFISALGVKGIRIDLEDAE
ncbi:hypothetical protein Dip518_000422 [Parelusimicrobium proximum]|uniref:hypothetical protein n=1 Tax=Parelusimicrobium proximum TaxID=3228953 RepID=UPI003D184451